MRRRIIEKIRSAIRTGNYDLTHHAIEEMAEDGLDIFDIESVILNGKVERKEKDDFLGVKYVINGVGSNKSMPIGVVGRFKETEIFLIITVYKIT